MPESLKRFFTKKPVSKLDFLLVWISISIVPFFVIPIVGALRGSVGQAVADNWMMFIVVPVVAAVTLIGIRRGRPKK